MRSLWRTTIGLGVLLAAHFVCGMLRAADEPGAPADRYGDTLPAGATARLGSVRYRIAGRKAGVGFAWDDRTLVVANEHGRIALCDVASGRVTREIGGEVVPRIHSQEDLRLNANRRAAVTIAREFDESPAEFLHAARVWDIQTGLLRRLLAHGEHFVGDMCDLSPDGRHLLFHSDRGALRVWDLDADSEYSAVDVSIGNPRALRVSPDGTSAVVLGSHGIYVWDWLAKKLPERVPADFSPIVIEFSPDGKLLAEARREEARIDIRDFATRRIVFTLAEPKGAGSVADGIAFSPDGRQLFAATGERKGSRESGVVLWDLEKRAIVRRFPAGVANPRVAVSGDGRWLAVAGDETRIKVWDLKTGEPASAVHEGHDDALESVHVLPDGQTAVTTGEDGTVRVWDLGDGKERAALRPGGWVNAAAVSPDGRTIAAAGLDDRLHVFETATGRELKRFDSRDDVESVRAMQFRPDGKAFVTWGDDRQLRTWDAQTGELLSERRAATGHMPAFSVGAESLALVSNRGVSILDVAGENERAAFPLERRFAQGLAFSPDGARLAVSAWGVPPVDAPGRVDYARAIGTNHRLLVAEAATGRELLQIDLPAGGAGPVAFSPDGRELAAATGARDRQLYLFDVATGQSRIVASGLSSNPTCLAYTADGTRIVCGFDDGTAVVWKTK